MRSYGVFNPHVDFAAERPEVDRLEQRLSTVLQGLAIQNGAVRPISSGSGLKDYVEWRFRRPAHG